MRRTKQKEPPKPKPFPVNYIEEYNNNCERLRKHETALIK